MTKFRFALLVTAFCLFQLSLLQTHASGLNIKNWAYQLQNADCKEIAESGFHLVVIDYSRNGSDEGMYSFEEIQMIKNSGKIPIAYISIGEAEDYRFYWNKEWYANPSPWLGKENPEWKGNYPVKYWYGEWKAVIFDYLDKILQQGFSGVYLDRVDVFEYWSDADNGGGFVLSEEAAAKRMIRFISEIAEYCRSKDPEFIIIPQNGERLVEFDYNGTYLSAISGIAVEDLWYNTTTRIEANITLERMQYIDEIKNAGKTVLSVDYVDDGSGYEGENKERMDDYIHKAVSNHYIPYTARSDRELDELNVIPSVQPHLPPAVNFTFSQPLLTGVEIKFYCNSEGSVVNYSWDFGDGISVLTNVSGVTHVYSSPGIYTVTLVAVDDWGFSNTTSKTIRIGLYGDVNEDGDVDFDDLIATLNLILKGEWDERADVDGDGSVDFDDLINLLNALLQ